MRVRVIAWALTEYDDFEADVNQALRDGWYLRDTHTPQTETGLPMLVAILVDDVEPREVRIIEAD
ncbi:MAG: hypothetical protein F4W95_06665 [Chloroflexi bacterium]|nr:hypothetical protein [Chloroflexota bacterium]MYD48152.1 hypothetical protein [Chloroflexota bacterium]